MRAELAQTRAEAHHAAALPPLTCGVPRAYKPPQAAGSFRRNFFGRPVLRTRGPARSGVSSREAHLPAEQTCAQAPSRISRPHGDCRRPQGSQCAPRPRPQEAVGLTRPLARGRALDGAAPASSWTRLKKRAEFQRAAKGRRVSTAAFTLQANRREGEAAGPRVGLTVTKKTGNSPVRNRIRRRLRAALAEATAGGARADHDYVLMARREALTLRFDALVADIADALRRTGAPRDKRA